MPLAACNRRDPFRFLPLGFPEGWGGVGWVGKARDIKCCLQFSSLAREDDKFVKHDSYLASEVAKIRVQEPCGSTRATQSNQAPLQMSSASLEDGSWRIPLMGPGCFLASYPMLHNSASGP